MKKISLNDITFFGGLLVLTAFFAWLVYCCFYFSESFDTLAIKNIDELLFQRSLLLARDQMRAGEWLRIFANADYAYGNIFWAPLFFISWPLAQWGPDWALIVMPRILSVLAFALALLAFYRICRYREYSRGQSMLALLLLASFRGIFAASLYFHNNTMIPALVVWSLYFLVLPPTKRNRCWAYVFFGMALGMKLTAVFALPIFLLFLNRDLRWDQLLQKFSWRRNVKAVALVLGLGVFFLSPTVLLLPFGVLIFYTESLAALRYVLITAQQNAPPAAHHFMMDFYEFICDYYFHITLLAAGFLLAIFLVAKYRNRTLDGFLFAASGLLSVVMMALLVLSNRRDPYFLRFYVMPLVFTFSFVFLELPLRVKKMSPLLLLAVVVSLGLGWRRFKDELFFPSELLAEPYSQERIKRLPVLREQVKLGPEEIVNMDFTTLFPFGALENYKQVLYFFTPGEPLQVQADVYILSKKNMIAVEEQYFSTAAFEKIFADEGMEIYRRRK